jgi:hypothetical protein
MALESLVNKLRQDRYILAAILYGSLARGEAWEKSDIDLTIIQQDGLDREVQNLWLVEDGINISATVISRSRFKRQMDGALQGSFMHSIRSQSQLLFTQDESITDWLTETAAIGNRDQEFQLLRAAAWVPPILDKAEKWFYVKNDPDYSFVWLIDVVNRLATIEVILNSEAPGREVIHQALKYNPTLFKTMYTDLIHGPKDAEVFRTDLQLAYSYLMDRAERLFKPILDYLAEAQGPRTVAELNDYFKNKTQTGEIFWASEWLARKGIIEKVAAPTRLYKKSQITLEVPAYDYHPDLFDWE